MCWFFVVEVWSLQKQIDNFLLLCVTVFAVLCVSAAECRWLLSGALLCDFSSIPPLYIETA